MAFAAVFLVGAVVVYGNFIRPALGEAEEKRSLVVSKEDVLEMHKGAVEQVQSIISQFQNLGQVRQTVGLAIPDDPSVTEALNQFYAIARNEGVDIQKFSVSEGLGAANEGLLVSRLGVLTIEAAVRGTYEGVKGFLEGVETNIRIANVKEIFLNPLKDGFSSTEPLFTLDFSVEVYYQRT